MRTRRKALQEARKSGLVSQKVISRGALAHLQDGINQNDFSRLENEGGPEPLISEGITDEAYLQSAEVTSRKV